MRLPLATGAAKVRHSDHFPLASVERSSWPRLYRSRSRRRRPGCRGVSPQLKAIGTTREGGLPEGEPSMHVPAQTAMFGTLSLGSVGQRTPEPLVQSATAAATKKGRSSSLPIEDVGSPSKLAANAAASGATPTTVLIANRTEASRRPKGMRLRRANCRNSSSVVVPSISTMTIAPLGRVTRTHSATPIFGSRQCFQVQDECTRHRGRCLPLSPSLRYGR